MEIESNNSLPFLDVLITQLPDSCLTHHVYQKKTHIDCYSDTHSHRHPSKNSSVIKMLISCALKICAPQFLPVKKAHLVQAFRANVYSSSYMNKAFKSISNSKGINPPSSSPQGQVSLPYIKCTIDIIAKFLLKRKFKAISKPQETLKQTFRSFKYKFDSMLNLWVFQIPHSCGKSYIGQTACPLKA